jgi:hypothetical protein
MAISSDGGFMVDGAVMESPSEQDQPRLYLSKLDQLEAKPIAGPAEVWRPTDSRAARQR